MQNSLFEQALKQRLAQLKEDAVILDQRMQEARKRFENKDTLDQKIPQDTWPENSDQEAENTSL